MSLGINMQFSKLHVWYLLTLCSVIQKQVHCEPQFPCFFIFGDSLVDNGNNFFRNTTAKVNYSPYGIDFPEGPTGRFTNGRNLADFLAELLGFENYIRPFTNATNEDFIRGVNYASGGAGILDKTGRNDFGDVISLNEQLSNHMTVVRRLAILLGGRIIAKQHLKRCMYAVVMGSNDYLATYLPKYYSSNTPYTPEQFADILTAKYSKQLRKMYYYGARKVAVFPVGKLGCTPQEVAKHGASEGSVCVETHNAIGKIFNEKLKLRLDDLNFNLWGANFVYTSSTSSSYGNITNLSDPCCKLTAGHCLPGASTCSNRDDYIFWDEVHPTEAAYSYDAKTAYTNMSPLYTDLVQAFGFTRQKIMYKGIRLAASTKS